MVAARRQHVDASESTVTGKVGIGPMAGGTFGLEVELHVQLPEVDRSVGEQLVTMAHAVCPYSTATRGNIQVYLFHINTAFPAFLTTGKIAAEHERLASLP